MIKTFYNNIFLPSKELTKLNFLQIFLNTKLYHKKRKREK